MTGQFNFIGFSAGNRKKILQNSLTHLDVFKIAEILLRHRMYITMMCQALFYNYTLRQNLYTHVWTQIATKCTEVN